MSHPLTKLEEITIETMSWLWQNLGKSADYDLHVISTSEEAGQEFITRMNALGDAIKERLDELKAEGSEETTSEDPG
ncbi:MAG TPA: hypothetical protein VL854_11935 [Nitrososphaeraceae archaeon]|nr:hypothetical protein [Nitrososphaeraceae archaeon]